MKQQDERNAALRAAPASQHGENTSVLTNERITEISRAFRNASGLLLMDLSFARAIEAEVTARFRAEGGSTKPDEVSN